MQNPRSRLSQSDKELIKACQAGETEAFRQLYQRHQKIVRSTLYHFCDPITLDDLVQEVFLKAWRGIGKMRHDSKFSTWLYRIAYNVGADYRKGIAHQLAKQEKSIQNYSESPTPQWEVLHHRDLIQRGIQQLSEEHAIVLVLSDLEEESQAEIARILDIPIGTVKSRLFHARSCLRKFFEQEGVTL